MIHFLNRLSLKHPLVTPSAYCSGPLRPRDFVLSLFPSLFLLCSFSPCSLCISISFSLHQQPIPLVLHGYTKGCEIVRAYIRSRNWRKTRARTKGFMQNKECKYKVDGVDSEEDGDGWVMHIRWTTYNAPSAHSRLLKQTREGIKGTKGRFRKFGRALNTRILCLLTLSPPRPYDSPSYFLSFVPFVCFTVCLLFLHFSLQPLFYSFPLSLYSLVFPSSVYSASALTVSWPDRTSLETTRNCV